MSFELGVSDDCGFGISDFGNIENNSIFVKYYSKKWAILPKSNIRYPK